MAKIDKNSTRPDDSRIRSEAMTRKLLPQNGGLCLYKAEGEGEYWADCVPPRDGGDNNNPPNNAEGAYAKNTYKNLRLYIKRVKCVDDTRGEWGDDEIDLAGVSIDATGDTNKIGGSRISNSFEDGDSRYYNPHWKYVDFTLSADGDDWPKYYAVSYLLAEIDHGGISDALDKLWHS